METKGCYGIKDMSPEGVCQKEKIHKSTTIDLNRHCRIEKKKKPALPHWHIDDLVEKCIKSTTDFQMKEKKRQLLFLQIMKASRKGLIRPTVQRIISVSFRAMF